MAEQADLVLELLRTMREQADLKREVRQGLTNLEHRLGRVESGVGEMHTDYAALSVRIDHLQADVRTLKNRSGTAL